MKIEGTSAQGCKQQMRRRDISSMCFPFLALGLNPEVHSSVTSYCTILSQWVFLRRKDEENTAHHHPTHWESILWREPDTETSEQIKEEKTAPRPQIFVHQHLHFQKKKKKKALLLWFCLCATELAHKDIASFPAQPILVGLPSSAH